MPFPRIDACIVCEGVRQEVLGKLSIIGFYGIAPHVRVAIVDFSLPVTLWFLFNGGPGSGTFRVNVRLTGPRGATVYGLEGIAEFRSEAMRSNIGILFQSTVPAAGQYTVDLLADGTQCYGASIEIEQGNLQEMRSLSR
jgi:hypothetical protein